MSTTAPRLALATLLVALVTLVHTGPAQAQDYPRLGLYGSIMGDGYPFTTGGLWGPANVATLDQVARYHEVILDASPLTEYRSDILAELRQRRPDIRLLAYVLGHEIWAANNPDSSIHFPTRYRHLVRDLDGFLYNKGGGHYSHGNVNLAKKDGTGRYVVAEALADLFDDAIANTGLWDGIFMDIYCETFGWSQTPSESIDIARAGYANIAAFDLAWKAGGDTLANRLRRNVGPNFILVGNCATSTKYASMNGWMHENFPFQNGGTWYENMFRTPGGYFTDEANFRQPTHDYLFSAVQGTLPLSANNARKVRLGLGSAALGAGYGVFGPSDRMALTAPYHTWWYDEYAVNRLTGQSTGNLTDTGWLGQPLGGPYQMIWAGTELDAVTNPDFETSVTTGWQLTYGNGALAAVTRDAATAATGSSSAKVAITTAGSVDWFVTFSTTTTLAVLQGVTHSATFWAKASTPRQITVVASAPGSGQYASRPVDLTTSWKQYQVALIPTGTGLSKLQFYVGRDAGNVWIDDAHLQVGSTSLWRRDFQNGIVLVNPAGIPMTVPLATMFQRITGLVDPIVNAGGLVNLVTVGGNDAMFLLSDDRVRPAAIQDLRILPR